jgi:hypothetical protein
MYRNLSALGVRDPALARFKGIYRATWCANQLLFRAMLPFVLCLQNAGVRVLLLKGTALSALHYRDLGARPMADLDVLVPLDQVPRALDLLTQCGLKRAPGAPDRFNDTLARLFHACTYEDASGRHLDLHWRLFASSPDRDDDAAVWDAAVPVEIQWVHALALCPADQFLHVCAHGVAWNHVPPLRWIADAATVLRASGDAVDWDRLRARASHHGLVLALGAALRTLEEVSGLTPPEGFLAALDAIRVSIGERIEFEASIQPLGLASWAARTRLCARAVARSPRGHRLEAIGEVLRDVTRTDRLSETPWLLARKLAWRIRRSAAAVAESARSRR